MTDGPSAKSNWYVQKWDYTDKYRLQRSAWFLFGGYLDNPAQIYKVLSKEFPNQFDRDDIHHCLIYRKFRIVGNQGCGFQYLILPPQSEPELHVANDFMNTFYESNPSIEPYYRYSIDATYGIGIGVIVSIAWMHDIMHLMKGYSNMTDERSLDLSKYGKWFASKSYVDEVPVYRLSGGYLDNSDDVKSRLSRALGIDATVLDDMVVYRSYDDYACNYWLIDKNHDARHSYYFSSIGTIDRSVSYYCITNDRPSRDVRINNLITIGLCSFPICLIAICHYLITSFNMTAAFGFALMSLLVVPFPAAFLFDAIDKTYIDIRCKDGLITNGHDFNINLYSSWIRSRIHSRRLADGIVLEDDKGYDVDYDSSEAYAYYKYTQNHGKMHSTLVGSDLEKLRHKPRVKSANDIVTFNNDKGSQIVKDEIINEIMKLLPKDSELASDITSMINNNEVDKATLAKLEASLHSITDNARTDNKTLLETHLE